MQEPEQKAEAIRKLTVSNLDETRSFAAAYLAELDALASKSSYARAIVVGLSGDLGAGKTAFSQAVAAELGILEIVTSPTFVIEKIYRTGRDSGFKTFVHIDAYRLEGGRELDVLGFKTLTEDPETLIFIEWPEKVEESMPEDSLRISFLSSGESSREISYRI